MRSYNNLANLLQKKLNIDAHYFLRGGFWLSLGQAATIGFGLISTALLAHFLTAQDYGVYRYLIGIAVILSSFSLTGLGQAILQTSAKKYDGFYGATLKNNFFYSLVISGASVIGTFYYWLQGNQVLAAGCLMIAILQPFITTFQNIQPLLQGGQQFKKLTIWHTVRMFWITLISIIAVFLTQNVLILFFVYLFGALIINIYSHYTFKPPQTLVPKDVYVRYLRYAKHTSVRNLVSNVAQRADAIIVFTQLGAVELAIYSIATVVPEQIKGSFKNLASLLLPKYAKHPNKVQVLKSIPKRSFQLFLLLLGITIVYIVTIPLIYSFLFPKYTGAILLTQILALSFPAMIAILPISALQAELREKSLYTIQVIESILLIVLTTTLTMAFGIIGAVCAKVATRYLTLCLDLFVLYKK